MHIPHTPEAIAAYVALNSEFSSRERVALNVSLDISNGLPDWIELIPAGPTIEGRDGRRWLFDQPQAVVRNSQLGADLPIDWEHSTELKAPNGDEAPAAAWIKQLEIRDGAMWGLVEWNERGRNAVMSREYKYLSPVFTYDKNSLRIVRLTSVGLVNKPNLQLPALNREEETPVTLKLTAAIALALAIPVDANEEQAMNAINALKGERDTALNRASNPPSLDKFVPRADYDTALNRATTAEQKLVGIEKKQTDDKIDAVVDAALKAGKITPATVDYHKASCRQEGGLQRFEDFVKVAPVIGDPTTLKNEQVDNNTSARNAEEQKIDAMFGNSADDLKKFAARA